VDAYFFRNDIILNFLMIIVQSINVVLSNFKNNIRQEQVSIFHVVCKHIPKEQAIALLKKCYQENSVTLKTFNSFAEAQTFVDELLDVGAVVEIQSDCVLFKKQMTKVQLSIGIAVLFISFVTKNIPLCISSILFIVFIANEYDIS
jgi:hypothetical protein